MTDKKKMTRREFIATCARGALGGGLAALAGYLAMKERKNPHSCINNGICRNCRELSACKLPQAVSAKKAGVKN